MEFSRVIELLSYCIPAVVTGAVALYFFRLHTQNEERKLKLEGFNKKKSQALPIQLQAYERMVLFLERINPSNLLIRIKSVNNDKDAYVQSLLSTIEQEFEHNLTQQIYISEHCWTVIVAAKNAIAHSIAKARSDEALADAEAFRENLMQQMLQSGSPTTKAISIIKEEVKNLF